MSELDQYIQEMMASIKELPPTTRYYVLMHLAEKFIEEIPKARKETMDEMKKQRESYKQFLKKFVEDEIKDEATDEGEIIYEDKEK